MIKRKQFARRLRNLGVETTVAQKISLNWERQVEARGPEGAVNYFKRVGDTLLWHMTGSGVKPEWVKVTKTGFPVFLDGCQKLQKEALVRISKFARSIVLEKPSDSQIGKVLPAVVTPFNGDPSTVGLVSQALERMARDMFQGDLTGFYNPRYPRLLRQFRRVQSVSGLTQTTTEPPLDESLAILARADVQAILALIPDWEKSLYPIHPRTITQLLSQWRPQRSGCVGEIHATQEGGAKLRMFASPYTVYQILLTPLHDYIVKVRKGMETDCTYDQEAGAKFAQSSMQRGLTVHSVDLSTATCRFPLEPQLAVLKGLHVPQGYLSLLEHVCRGEWSVGTDLQPYFESETIRWQVGQPLGIRPSMSMFSLTHNMLLTWICHQAGVIPADTFRVLGDDVVINDDNVHLRYREIITKLGIPISENKSHSSAKYAEFAGFCIFPDSMFRPGQWRSLERYNVTGVAEQLLSLNATESHHTVMAAARLIHYINGTYAPPDHMVDKWETAKQHYGDRSTLMWDKLFKSTAPLWRSKVVQFVRSRTQHLTGMKLYFYPMQDPTAVELLHGLPDIPEWLRNYAYTMDEFMVDTEMGIVQSGFQLCAALLAAYNIGGLDWLPEQLDEAVSVISDNTNAELWQPPPKRKRSTLSEFNRLLDALKFSGLVK